MRRKRTGNTWRFIAAFALSTVLILDGLAPAWSAAAGPESLTGRNYEGAGNAGPYGLARFISGNGEAGLEALLFDVLGEDKAVGAEVEQETSEDAWNVSTVLVESADQEAALAANAGLAVLEMLGWTEDTEMSQRLVGSWGTGVDEDDSELFWPEFDGFEGEWLELPEGEKESSDSIKGEWLEDSHSGDGSKEDDWGALDVEFDANNAGSAGADIEPDADDSGGSDTDSVRMPVWKAHYHTQERESKREITLNIDSVNSTGFTNDDAGFSDAGSADGAAGHGGDSDIGSNGGSQDGENPPSGNNGSGGDDQNTGEDNDGGSGNSGEGPGNTDGSGDEGSDGAGDGDNEDQDKDPDDEDRKEGADTGDAPGGDGEEKDDGEEVESDEKEQEQEDPVQEEASLYISPEGVWDGSIAESFAGGTGTASDPYLISNGAELAYLAQQVNNGTTYSGKYFLQTGDIVLNQYIPGLNSVQKLESIAKDDDFDEEQDADGRGEDGGDGTEDKNDGSAVSEDESAGSDEAYGINGERERDASAPRAVSSVVVVPEGESAVDDGKYEPNKDSDVDYDADSAEKDTTLEEEPDDENEDEEKEEQQVHSLRTSDEPLAWTPIGYSSNRSFSGAFDGGGFTISGIYINTTDNYQGLFGYASGVVKNIQITNSSITGGNYVGGIAGRIGTVENCNNYGNIAGNDYIGGLAGEVTGTVTGSWNSGNIEAGGSYAGGLGGRVSRISESENHGSIKGFSYIGGLTGYTTGDISQGRNSGSVEGSGDRIGGIAGAMRSGKITNCENNADITGRSYVGGIVGYTGASGYGNSSIWDSVSRGDVYASSESAGGILGYSYSSTEIRRCSNEGEWVRAEKAYAGGIAGRHLGHFEDCETSAQVYSQSYVGYFGGSLGTAVNCVNYTDIILPESSYVGGLAGHIGMAVNCENYGRITGKDNIGGIAGSSGGISGSFNEGEIAGESNVGGLTGRMSSSTGISDSVNQGNIKGKTSIGGLGGYVSAPIAGSINSGSVEGGGYTGGLAGSNYGDISDSRNEGQVSGGERTGGIVGSYSKGAVSACENNADVEGGAYTGGIAGYAGTGNQLSIEDSINRGSIRGTTYAGGIVGYGSVSYMGYRADIIRCINEGELVHAEGSYGGGIAGYANGKIEDCETSAQVSASSYGGIYAGYAGYMEGYVNHQDAVPAGSYAGTLAGSIGTAVDCINYADVYLPESSYVGGLAGHIGTAVNCENYGRITGKDNIGGIAGSSGGISGSFNEGEIAGESNVGGLAGRMSSSTGISDSVNQGNIKGKTSIGGLGGYLSGPIAGSINSGRVEGGGYTGGLAGSNYGDISDSRNEGQVSGGERTGGIVGSYSKGAVSACENNADVEGGAYTGGIAGYAGTGNQLSIEDSINRGSIRGTTYAGGIVGYGSVSYMGYRADIIRCINEGDMVHAEGSYGGGIAGYVNGVIEDCETSAQVSARSYAGGIAGYVPHLENYTNHASVHASDGYAGGLAGSIQTVENCENYGSITGKDYIGGIAGTVSNSLSDCTNGGAVNGTGIGAGGIVGRLSSSGAYISDSTNTVAVRGNNSVGGIIGEAGRSDNTVLNCDNTGSHVSGSGSYVGGIAGYTIGDIINSISSANIHAEGSYAGGIAGLTEKDITGYTNYVNVHASESHAGGIAGSVGIAENCTNYGFITGGSYIGGIAGFTLGIAESTNYANLVKGNGDYVGGLAGYAVGSITDSSNSASVEGKNRVGGIAGELYNGKVISTENIGSQVTGTEDYVGGIAGSIRGTSEISDSINRAEIAGRDHTGGVAGGTPDSSGKNAVIADSSTKASVSGRDRVGGIAGSFQGTINSSQVSGSITGVNYLGGIAGDSSGIIQECTNETILSGSDYVGGIAGRAGSVSMSSNEASISGANYTGGIAGIATGVITGSQNKAQINGSGDYTGGIAGYTTKELISSRSEGEIIGHNYVGGIAGYAGKITDYTNEADVTGTGVRVGGIAGQVNILEKCLNKGTVTGGTEAAGGLAGTVTGSVTDSYNYGRVSGSGIKVGGIAGEHTGSTLDNCVNLETVSGESYVGGVVGWSSGTINSSWNTASVRALSDVVGGIAGYSSRAINDSHNKGSVTGSGLSAGGIAGYQSGTVTTSRNMGTISGVEAVGGVVGFKQSGTIDRSLNTGLIIYSELDAGGVAGKINGSTIVDCYNLGQITGRGDQAGGIVGGSYGSGQIRNTYNTGRVSADTYRGGIIGYDNYRNPVMKNNYYVIGTAAQGIGSFEEDDDHDLSELFMRVSSSELQGMAYRLGSSYHNDIMNSNQGYPLLRDVDYSDLEIPSDVTFGLYTLGKGDISILVSEKQNPNAAKEGVPVALSGFESDETNDRGLVVFHDPLPTSGIDRKALTVQLDGYRLYYGGIDIIRDQNAAALYDTNQFLAMLTPLKADDTAKPYISTLMHYSRNDSTQDTLTSMVSVLKNSQTELHMYAVWNGKQPEKYVLFQKSGGRLESGSGVFNTNLTDTFAPGETIYAQVIASDGTESDVEETLLQVLNVKAPSFIDFFRGAEIKLPGEKIPFFQGMIDPELTKIPIQVKIDNTKIRVAIGKEYSEELLNEKEWDDWSKNWDKFMFDEQQKLSPQKTKWMDALAVTAKAAGYAEARFSDMDYSALYELEAGAAWELKGELSRTMVRPIGYIPVYVKLTGGVDNKGQGYHTFSFIGEETPLLNLGGEFVIKGMGELGVGIPKVVTAGVEGKLSFPLEYAGGVIKRIYGKGALTFKASAFGFSYDKLIGSPVELIEIYPEPGLFPDRLMLDTAALYDTAQYKPTSLDYTLKGSQWYGGGLQAEAAALAADLIAPASTVITGETLLQTNINQDSKPQIVAVGDTYAAVWIVNNAERGGSHPNWTMLVYSVYDPISGTWSEPVPVDDDGTADFNPSLKAGGGRLYVAWQNANQVFEEEDLTLEAFIAASEIAAAEFDPVSRKFGPVRRITENNSLDMTPALAVSDQGAASVVWLTNSENDIFGMTGSTAVMAYDFAGGGTNVLKGGLGSVSSLDAAYINGILTAAYSLDWDGDLSTLEDQEIYMVTTGREPVRITDNDVMDSNPTFGKYKDQDALFFYSEGKLLAHLENGDIETIFEDEVEEAWVIDEDGELYVPETGLLTDDFQVMTSANGHTAVIWTKIQDDESRQIEGILYNKDKGQWSREVKISDSQADVLHPSGIIMPDGTMKILYSRYTAGQEWGDYGQSDLCLMDLAPSYDLAVEGVYYDSHDLVPGSEIEISVLVKNNGYLPVEQIQLRIGGQETVREIHLLPGESSAVQSLYRLPETIDLETLTMQVSVPGESDITPLDNLAEITWGHADASLQVQELVNAHGQVANIKVSNHSYKDTRGELVIRINGIDGQIYEVIDLGTLTNDTVKVLSYGITEEIKRIPGIESLYFIVETDQEELYESNNYDYININWYR